MTQSIRTDRWLFAVLVAGAGSVFAQTPHVDAGRIRVREAWRQRFQDARDGKEQTERFSKTFKTGPDGSLDLSNIAGDIDVQGAGSGEMRIEAVKRARSRSGDARHEQFDGVKIDVTERANRVEVRTLHTTRTDRVSVDYMVTVPPAVSVSLKSVSGSIKVTNVNGELRLESVSGNVSAVAATHLTLVKSVSGDVEVSGAATDGELNASSVSGHLFAKDVSARSLDVSTVSGDLVLTNVSCDRVHLRSVSGEIEYSGRLSRNGRYEMNSHSGDVRLIVADSPGFEVDASSFSGTVRSDLPLTTRSSDERGDPDRPGRRSSRFLRGTSGDASASVELRTFSGDIVISTARSAPDRR